MHKMNCPKAKKTPKINDTLETLIVTQNLVSAQGEWGHLHINCPL